MTTVEEEQPQQPQQHQPAGVGGHDAFHERCRHWNERLVQADAFAGVILVCQDICTSIGRTVGSADRAAEAASAAAATATTTTTTAMDKNGDDDSGVTDAATIPAEHVQYQATYATTLRLLGKLLHDKRKTHAQRKIVAKAYYSLCYENLRLGVLNQRSVSGIGDLHDADQNSVALYGMLNSCFLRRVQTDPELAGALTESNLALFLATTGPGYSRSFSTLAENVLTIERVHLFRDAAGSGPRYGKLWTTALMNLESPYHGVRESMLALIKCLARDEPFMRGTVLPAVAQWSWTNRNKLHVMGVLLGQYRLHSLLPALNLNYELLAQGVMLSLRYKHLYTGGQTLVRLLARDQQMPEFVYGMVVRVIREWDIPQLLAMGKFWFSSFGPRDSRRIFELLELERIVSEALAGTDDAAGGGGSGGAASQLPPYLRANRHEKLFHLALFFRRELHEHAQLPQYLTLLCELADGQDDTAPLPPVIRGLLVEALGYHITTDRPGGADGMDILQLTTKLAQYVLDTIETPGNMAVCTANAVVCQRLLRHVVSAQATFDAGAQAVVSKLMSYEMYDRYLLPTGPTKQLLYQPTITALRMFACFVDVFFEFSPSSRYVLQTRPNSTIDWIGKLLPATIGLDELASSFRSMVYGLQHLFRSDFDDVRTVALQMLYNKAAAHSYEPALQARLGELFSRDDPDYLAQSMVALLADTVRRLDGALVLHRRDFYGATLQEEDDPNSQLYRLVDRATEILYGRPDRAPELMARLDVWAAVEAVRAVVELSLLSLNAARAVAEPAATGTNFGIMERSMQLLLDRSEAWDVECVQLRTAPSSAQIALAKRTVQGALWKALRASAMSIECSALWMVEQHLDGRTDAPYVERLEGCLRLLFDISIQCCHRGAIEVAGHCLGRIGRRIMQLRQTVLTVAVAEADGEEEEEEPHEHGERFERTRQIVRAFERFFRACLVEHQLAGDDFRRCRGYLWAMHCCIRSEVEGGGGGVEGSLLRYFLDERVQLEAKARRAMAGDEDGGGEPGSVGVLELHQLNLLARETSLNESMLPHVDQLLVVALTHFASGEWPVRNAALQLYASCVTKLTGQRQQYLDPDSDWPPAYVSFDEVLRKVTGTLQYTLRRLQAIVGGGGGCGGEPAGRTLTTPFLLLVLEFLSKVEYRAYHPTDQRPTLLAFRAIIWQLLRHEHDTVRKMAARCFAQLHDFRTELPAMFENLVVALFTSATGENFRHGLCQALAACVRKRVTLGRHLADGPLLEADAAAPGGDARDAALQHVRQLVTLYYALDEQLHLVSTYRFRCELLELLLYLGFPPDSNVVLQLIHNRVAPNKLGLDVFLIQASRVYNALHPNAPHSTAGTATTTTTAATTTTTTAATATTATATTMPYEIELAPRPHDDLVVYGLDEH
uniref:DUF2428 domain-containing protein n=1 Tax=Anopheles dirus TaxID=7168 RepID=A0A182N1B6_9DIPT